MTDIKARLFFARSVHDAGRNEDAAAAMREILQTDHDLEEAEKRLIVNIWTELITPLRFVIQNIESSLNSGDYIKIAVSTIKATVTLLLDEIINFEKTKIIPTADSDELRAIHTKELGDFIRYKINYLPDDQKEAMAGAAKQAYTRALEILKVMPNAPPDLEMKIQLNYAILKADWLGQRDVAIETITNIRNEIKRNIEKYPEDLRPTISDLEALMGENLEIWTSMNSQ